MINFVRRFVTWTVSCVLVFCSTATHTDADDQLRNETDVGYHDVGFVGLHGGVFDQLQQHAKPLGITLRYFEDDQIASKAVALNTVSVIYIQHIREEDREAYRQLIQAGLDKNPQLRIFALQPNAIEFFRSIGIGDSVKKDPQASKYYGSSSENLRRMLTYIAATHLGRSIQVELPQEVESSGLYHPDHGGLFRTAEEFLAWKREKSSIRPDQPRILIAVHSTHLFFQQPAVIDALIHECEKQGAVAAAIIDGRLPTYEEEAVKFAPGAMIHTCHSMDSASLRLKLRVPHLHSIFLRSQPMEDWEKGMRGLSSSELAFHVIGQELLGAIEPQVAGGYHFGRSSADAFQPIPERVEHLVSRALSFTKLSERSCNEKKVAIIYYDREMGKGELMRGSATGMHMNAPRSLVQMLKAMKDRGYQVDPIPMHEDQLLAWLMERGKLVGVWAPAELERTVRFGNPVLIPANTYKTWYESKVPMEMRHKVEEKWGPPPGRFMVWKDRNDPNGSEFIVVPRVDLGNVILMPQPLRGEVHGKEGINSQAHDKLSTPPHNYLATYFWLREDFQSNALIHFGTHGSEFALPGKSDGLSRCDWPDIIMGNMPNFNPWIIENMVESSPVKRRVYGTLISHLSPPILTSGLNDSLMNIQASIDKWNSIDAGALKSKFATDIFRQIKENRIDIDLGIKLELSNAATESHSTHELIERVSRYLQSIQEDTTPKSLHVFGTAPAADLMPDYIVNILRQPFLERLRGFLVASKVPSESSKQNSLLSFDSSTALNPKFIREIATRTIKRLVAGESNPCEALSLEIGWDVGKLTEPLDKDFALVNKLLAGFSKTSDEISNLLDGLDGRYVPPGPGNNPIRNPDAVPTGRNMYLLNPQEIPTRPSWELGKQLANDLIERHSREHGQVPTKIGFDLRSSATFRDYGVMEAQILALIGVEPIWDDRQLVNDVRLISRDDLGRPRVDVFIAAGSWYESNLPTRLNIWDKAIRLAIDSSESDNPIRSNTLATQRKIFEQGVAQEQASNLSKGRIFGIAPGRESTSFLGYSVARSGDWNSRFELADEYLATQKNVYTEGAWGDEAVVLYDTTIQGTHTVVRSWSDHMTGPLSSKYTWLHGGSLSLAVEKLTGKKPEYILSDVRDPDKASIITAEEALRREFRVRLFNRSWIEGMMKEGYAGADHMRVIVSNSFGWDTMRPGTIGNDQWLEMKQVLLDDKQKLGLRDWLEKSNPYALQDSTAVLLEAIRKGFWEADAATIESITEAYSASVATHGLSGHITSGGNMALDGMVRSQLQSIGSSKSEELLAMYTSKFEEQQNADFIVTPSAPQSQSLANIQTSPILQSNALQPPALQPSVSPNVSEAPASSSKESEPLEEIKPSQQSNLNNLESVTGNRLESVTDNHPNRDVSNRYWLLVVVMVSVFAIGFLSKRSIL